jgi:hypothetical protein
MTSIMKMMIIKTPEREVRPELRMAEGMVVVGVCVLCIQVLLVPGALLRVGLPSVARSCTEPAHVVPALNASTATSMPTKVGGAEPWSLGMGSVREIET